MSCGSSTGTPPVSGKRISDLTYLSPISASDLFVVVDTSNVSGVPDITKHTTYGDITIYDNTGTSLSAGNFQDAITELGYAFDNSGFVPSGGIANQTLVKVTSADYDYTWSDVGSGDMLKSVYDANDNGIVDDSEKLGGEYPSYYATSSTLINYTLTADFIGHENDTSIHYEQVDIDHEVIMNVGMYVHSAIDAHIDNTSIHFTKESIDGLVVSGGNTGDVLTKNTNTDYDYSWVPSVNAGNTASRPVSPLLGFPYFDTDLGYQINYNGTNWVNATGAVV